MLEELKELRDLALMFEQGQRILKACEDSLTFLEKNNKKSTKLEQMRTELDKLKKDWGTQ